MSEGRNAAPPSRGFRIALIAGGVLAFLLFVALGSWQVQRLAWKRDLIARVEQRVHAVPTPAPGRQQWPAVDRAADEYRHVRVSGRYLPEHSVRVQAVTDLGGGFWLVTPLRTADGAIVLINRGFIAGVQGDNTMRGGVAAATACTPDEATVTGLLRISEPGGAFLRHNDPAHGRWYSRDVQAIAAAQGLAPDNVAPYFIDADSAAGSPSPSIDRRRSADMAEGQVSSPAPACPVGGLTVIRFPNNHLVYAVTWYLLALMVAGAGFWLRRQRHRIP